MAVRLVIKRKVTTPSSPSTRSTKTGTYGSLHRKSRHLHADGVRGIEPLEGRKSNGVGDPQECGPLHRCTRPLTWPLAPCACRTISKMEKITFFIEENGLCSLTESTVQSPEKEVRAMW